MLRRRILYRKKQIVDYNPDYSADDLVFSGRNYVDTGIKLCDSRKDFTVFLSLLSQKSDDSSYATVLHSMSQVSPWVGFVYDLSQQYWGSIYGRLAGSYTVGAVGIYGSTQYNVHKCFALRRSGDTVTLFTSDNASGIAMNPTDISSTHNNTVTLGAMHDNGSSYYYRYWKGTIYKVRIYLKALTDSQIQDLINNAMS